LTRDAAVAAALVLQLLLETGVAVEEHVGRERRYSIVKEKLPRDAGSLEESYRLLEEELEAPESDRQDGLWLAWPGEAKWLHLRPSGTEPILRIIAEAADEEEARALVARARRALEGSGGRAGAAAAGSGPAR